MDIFGGDVALRRAVVVVAQGKGKAGSFIGAEGKGAGLADAAAHQLPLAAETLRAGLQSFPGANQGGFRKVVKGKAGIADPDDRPAADFGSRQSPAGFQRNHQGIAGQTALGGQQPRPH